MKYNLLQIAFLVSGICVQAQSPEINELKKLAIKELTLSDIQNLVEYYKYKNNDTAFVYAQELLDRNTKINNIQTRLDNVGLVARVYIHLGYYDLALRLYQEIIPEVDSVNYPDRYADALHYMANLHGYMDHFNISIATYKRSLSYRDTSEHLKLIHTYHGLGDNYRFLEEYDSSYLFLSAAYKLLPKINHKEIAGQVSLAFAETLLKRDSLQKAKEVYDFTVGDLGYGDDSNLAQAYVIFIRGLLYAGNGEYDSAISLILSTKKLMEESNYNYGIITGYRELIPILEKAEKYELAHYHNKLFNEYLINNYQSGIEKQVRQLEIIHETKQKEQAIQNQKFELQKRQAIISALIIVVLLVVVLLLIVFRSYSLKQKMASNLAEKNTKIETLMRELHHRVKNNLQVISSLLGLQSMKMEEGEAKQAVEEGKSRVRAMAMIHQKLYKKEDLMGVDFYEYVYELVNELKNTFCPERNIEINVNVPKQSLDVDVTLPLGLIINEIVSNAFKYAYEKTKQPTLTIEFKEEGQTHTLVIGDNGIGLPSGFDFKKANSFGMRLINILCRQLHGSINIEGHNGLVYKLVFAKN